MTTYRNSPSVKLPNFVPSDNPCTIYLLPNFVVFADVEIDKKTLNGVASALRLKKAKQAVLLLAYHATNWCASTLNWRTTFAL